ncbi:Aste57867_12178 [Aphanomyces stellatus]|uniref:Aste57867_12178 protein n=1 Tax=Aphanomyces stellatus TaxID=120398 RepID=A0A485KW96_9STRA|nr:hypothetical protein As57867_012133 [Aphanomyces stellatus]VFT89032.1 Aste57867_12178 [Aphanomyces stellatus]
MKPALTDANKRRRLKWALDRIHGDDGLKCVDPMFDTVHVDEKWFFISRVKKTVYGVPEKKVKQRSCKAKRFILKVMFLSAVARPRWDHDKDEWFMARLEHDTLPKSFSPSEEAVAVMLAMLIDKVIPAIHANWPRGVSNKIKIQQVNARPHVPPLDMDVVAACTSNGWDMEVVFQPPNSPDINVLDLGFFRAIRTLQLEELSSSLEEIVDATEAAWEGVSMQTLDKNFISLQCCIQEVIRARGATTINDYSAYIRT